MTGRRRVIVGLGKTGLSCARYFRSIAVDFLAMDSRIDPPGLAEFRAEFPDVELVLGDFPVQLLCSASELVVSPGVSLQIPAIKAAIDAGVMISGDIDIFSKVIHKPLVAVTGSNGKSTVVSLLGAMAAECGINAGVGGNLDGEGAAPALDLIRNGARDLYILELSSFQLETTRSLGAEAAVILNISEDHLDRYASMHEYEEAKQRIFLGCRQILVNRDDPATAPWQAGDAVLHSYGLTVPEPGQWGVIRHNDQDYLAFGDDEYLAARDLKIAGRHNVSNALAALALGTAIGLPRSGMIAALRKFPGLPHRCQWLRSLRGVDFYNDSKGTNVGAALVAIESLGELRSGKIVLIAGGIDKEADFSLMLPALKKYVRLAVLIGRDAPRMQSVFKEAIDTVFAASMEDAVTTAFAQAQSGDAVLLSPACASFDMFNDFTHRGRVFSAFAGALS